MNDDDFDDPPPDFSGPGKRLVLAFRCQRRFEELTRTDHPHVFHCGACNLAVLRVRTAEGLQDAIAQGLCIFVHRWSSTDDDLLGVPARPE